MILDSLKNFENYYSLNKNFKQVGDFFKTAADKAPGRYELEDGTFVNLIEGDTGAIEGAEFEAHRKYIDVHYVISGVEGSVWADIADLEPTTEYKEDGDCQMLKGEGRFFSIGAGQLYIDFPCDAHLPMRDTCGKQYHLKKCIGKVPVK